MKAEKNLLSTFVSTAFVTKICLVERDSGLMWPHAVLIGSRVIYFALKNHDKAAYVPPITNILHEHACVTTIPTDAVKIVKCKNIFLSLPGRLKHKIFNSSRFVILLLKSRIARKTLQFLYGDREGSGSGQAIDFRRQKVSSANIHLLNIMPPDFFEPAIV